MIHFKGMFFPGEEEVVNNRLRVVREMAIDWTTNNLYILDVGRKAVIVVNTKDTSKYWKTLVSDGLSSPTSIAISPGYG